ncbi:MAG TPA: hypothetical protein IAB43_02690 [Candidatus Spyradocola merdavium]|nr:hypothetical protein [Candidatus Spyradocola merdavium]
MVYEQDYILRQIEILMQGIRRVFFGKREKGAAAFAVSGALPGALWYTRVLERLEAGDVNGAENLLFALMDPAEPQGLLAALDFYNRLRRIPEERLLESGFSLAEVEQGLLDAAALYGLDLGGPI